MAAGQSTFGLLQPSLCEGAFVVHPSLGQCPLQHRHGRPWSHIRAAELQARLVCLVSFISGVSFYYLGATIVAIFIATAFDRRPSR